MGVTPIDLDLIPAIEGRLADVIEELANEGYKADTILVSKRAIEFMKSQSEKMGDLLEDTIIFQNFNVQYATLPMAVAIILDSNATTTDGARMINL